MEVVGTLASVTAVVELSAKVLSLCVQYSVEVKDSERDIKRLQVEVLSLNGVLEKFKELLEGPDGTKLSASQEMDDTLDGCSLQLESLRKTLDPGKSRKVMSRMGLRALKWPFESKQVDKAIRVLERSKQTVSLALQVDQTRLIIDVHQKIDIAKLPSAEGAAFDSLREENEARCLQGTRTDLLRQIKEWADDPQGKCIFWLNGMAGTGKSTISRSIAQMFTDEGRLGASFFFKRGEMDRGTAAKFFTTIAVQLVTKVPRLIPYVRKAIEAEPTIAEKAMKEQFEKLILQPLCEIKHVSPLVVIIDALDECEPEDHIFNILHLLSQTRSKFKGSVKCLRIFVTSRPELPIRFGFNNMQGGIYQDLVLQDIPQSIIEHDISTFLSHEFAEIKKRHDGVRPEYRWLRSDWPGERNIRTLVQMATPLFIFAATVCRFIGDSTADPEARLATVLSYQKQNWESIDKTYIPILNQLLVNSELTDSEKENITKEFRNIVGPIIILADPLSTASLASLLNIPRNIIDYRLDSLHSVLSVHQDSPVRLLHLSFRDFLLDKKKREKNAFWVDERKTNEMVAIKCIERISIITSLRKNICNLESFEKLRTEIDSEVINKCLPADIQYACRYWVYHLKQSESRVCDQDRVHRFLQERFLYWLEALSLMGRMSESIALISTLQSLVTVAESTQVARFLEDAKRFVLRYRWIVDYAPLQLYASAIVFAPETSIIKNKFQDLIPDWISRLPIVESTWSTTLQILEGHANGVHAVAFSPDGRLVASGSFDETVRLWDVSTGAERATLSGHSGWVNAVAFSPDGRLVASGSLNETVRLWDVSTGAERATLSGHSGWVNAVAFSPDGRLVASGSLNETVRLWDVSTGAERATLSGHSGQVRAVAFSPDGRLIASGSDDKTVRLWDVSTGAERATLSGHSGSIHAVAFSPDGRLVASGSYNDNTVRLWDVSTGAKRAILWGHSGWVNAVAFSPDGRLIASGSNDKTVKLWDVSTGVERATLSGYSNWVNAVAFSPDGRLIASGSNDKTVKLWDVSTGVERATLSGHSDQIYAVAFSPDGRLIASGSLDKTVRLWDVSISAERAILSGHSSQVHAIAFSLDGQLIASGSDDKTVKLWDVSISAERAILSGHSSQVRAVAFSPDGRLIASGSFDKTVKLWDVSTGAEHATLSSHSHWIRAVAFSSDGRLIASGSEDTTVKLWDVSTGVERATLSGHWGPVYAVAFSPDGRLVASGSFDNTVMLWDVSTGAKRATLSGHSSPVHAVAFSPDGRLVASGSVDKTVRLWDAKTMETTRIIETEQPIRNLSFSHDGSYIQTEHGPLYISQPPTGQPLHSSSYFYVQKHWLAWGTKNILWLPSDYRPTDGGSVAVRGDTVAIGHASGRVSFFEFDLTKL